MFNIRLGSALCSIVEAMLPIGSEHGLFIMCDMRLENEKTHKRNSTDLVFIFYRKTNYTKVFVAQSEKWIEPEAESFKLSSDHDSCWRTDGVDSVISNHFFRMADQVRGKQAPKDLWEFVNLHEIKKVKVVVDKQQEGNEHCVSYRAHLVSYEDLK